MSFFFFLIKIGIYFLTLLDSDDTCIKLKIGRKGNTIH